jgi:hypothetical protein
MVRGVRSTPISLMIQLTQFEHICNKKWKTINLIDVNKIKYDSSMNKGRVVTKNAFDSLRNRWKILRHFNFKVDRAPKVAITCCVLHIFVKFGINHN